MDGEYLGPLIKILDGKLEFEKGKLTDLGNHIKSHSQSRRPQPSLQPLIQFDFCLNSISAIKKKEIEWAGGPPGFSTKN
jgi:hypothetical protein